MPWRFSRGFKLNIDFLDQVNLLWLDKYLSVSAESEIYIKSKRTLSLAVNFKPLVNLYLEGGGEAESFQVFFCLHKCETDNFLKG